MRTTIKALLAACALLFSGAGPAIARPLRVVATIPDLAFIAGEIGGEKVTAESLISGRQDPHFIEPRPSMVARVRNADLFIVKGMELDVWAFALVDASRNRNIVPGARGYLNASARVRKLEVPEAGVRIDASQGHVHPAGNPHYLLDPLNGVIVAETVADRLAQLRPGDEAYFRANLERFRERAEAVTGEVREILAPHGKIRVVTYHKTWEYFEERFGIEIAGILEPLPGVPPTTRHLASIVALVGEREVDLVLQAAFYPRRAADFVSARTGIPVVVAPAYVGGVPGAGDYFEMFRVIARGIAAALEGKGPAR